MGNKDYIGTCPLTSMEDGAYITPINETLKSYKSLITGFYSSDLMVEGEFDFDKFEESLPELYKDVKQVDVEGRVWYPQVINVEDKGIVFVGGTSKDDYGWVGIKHTPVLEEEKEKFKRPDGSYISWKNDPKTMKKFGKNEFIKSKYNL